ncbi:alpha/beta hydrolase [Streptomyces sp. V2]|uniref:alpha/beta hydrolase n=1 Tax=Streptomyces TaxID=1883 RepID=UPI0006EBDCD8|nr:MULTISPECIES: alpha/beta hydrolase [Streptomyces]PWG12245.1 alpha/beta hydrolase [Streptomyces sp. V2]
MPPEDSRAYEAGHPGPWPELLRPTPSTPFEGVRSHLDVPYAVSPGFRPLVLDLHLPDDGRRAARPVVVYAHGGGFFTGTKAMGPWRFLLDAGYAVASVGYRLSGESRFPGPVHDVAAAVRWVRANADTYGLDADRVVGFGSSAGGYLVGAVALGADDAWLVGRLGPHARTACTLAAVIDHCAPNDYLRLDDDVPDDVVEVSNGPGSSAARFLGYVPSDRPAEADRARLSRYVRPDSPPFLIAHGDADRRVGIGQSRRLHRALRDRGVPAELVVLPGAGHADAAFDTASLHDATLAFLSRALGQPGKSLGGRQTAEQ